MKNITKIILGFILVFSSNLAFGQQTICPEEIKDYTVDLADGTLGTPGSTYAWSVQEATFLGNISNNTTSGNNITIDWDNTPPGTYTLQVIETNNGCPGEPQLLTIIIAPLPVAPTVTSNSPICEGEDAVFTITGTPNLVVNYTLDGVAGTVTLDGTGSATVTQPGATADVNLTITDIDNGVCAHDITDISTDIVVNALPVAPTVTSNSPICEGEDAVFTITGTPNLVVNYTLDGVAGTVTLDGTGSATVTQAGATADVNLTITDIDNGVCAHDITDISTDIVVNALPVAPTITSNSPICEGEDAVFTITGTPNLVVNYTLDGVAGTVTLDGTGSATVTQPGATADVNLTITDIDNGVCANDVTDISTDVVVNPTPVTSNITFD